MATIEVECRVCKSHESYHHGKASSGEQCYRCKECGHCFQLDYRYNGNQLGITDLILDMAMNAGRGISRFTYSRQRLVLLSVPV